MALSVHRIRQKIKTPNLLSMTHMEAKPKNLMAKMNHPRDEGGLEPQW